MPKNEFTCDCGVIHHELVESVLSRMPSEEVFASLAAFYKVLSDPTRCKLISALQSGEMCVCDLANVLSMSKSSVSHQLGKMRQNGVVRCRREGKEVYYSIDDEHVAEIFALTLAHVSHKPEGNA